MGMAPYSHPRYIDNIEKIMTVSKDGSIWLDLNGLDPCTLYQHCNGHFTAAGYKLLADIVSNEIRTSGIWPSNGTLFDR